MKRSRVLSFLLAVSIVLSMVVFPVSAEGAQNETNPADVSTEETTSATAGETTGESEPYAIKLSDKDGNTTFSAAAGTTVDVYLSTVGDCPGFTSVGAYVYYPQEWAVSITDLGSPLLNQDGMTRVYHLTNEGLEVSNPSLQLWCLSAGTTNGDTTEDSITYITGNLAKFSFTIPRNMALGTYELTLNTEYMDLNTVFPHDENGVITGWIPDVMQVPGIPCTIEVTECEDADSCPEHTGKPLWDDVTNAMWKAGGALTSGHYKLTENVNITAALTIAADQEVCIDLNGYNIKASATYTNPYRVFENKGKLTLMDKTAAKVDGVYTSGAVSGGYMYNTETASSSNYVYALGGNLYNEGIFNLYSGQLIDGTARVGNVYCAARGGNYYGTADSVMNMYGGVIAKGKANTSSYTLNNSLWCGGGNICSQGTVNITSGTLSDGIIKPNSAYSNATANRNQYYYGGNIAMDGGILNITDSIVTGGRAEPSRKNATRDIGNVHAFGGNIYAKDTAVTISGTVISNGVVKAIGAGVGSASAAFADEIYASGGNICISGGSFSMTGGSITGGTAEMSATNLAAADTEVNTTKDSSFKGLVRGGNLYVDCEEPTIVGTTISGGCVINDNAADAVDGYGTCQGGNIYIGSGTYLKISGNATVTDGVVEQNNYVRSEEQPAGGGNIFAAGSVQVVGSVVSGGKLIETHAATGNGENMYFYGGNIYVSGALLKLSGSMVIGGKIDITRTDAAEAATYTEGVFGRGGNIYTNTADVSITNTVIDDGNVKITVHTKGTADNAFASAESCGGNLFVKDGTLNMYGGAVSGGNIVLSAANGGDTAKDSEAAVYIHGANIAMSGVQATFNKVAITGGHLTKLDDEALETDGYGVCQGGSIYLNSTSSLEIKGKSNITGGENLQGNGGTIYTEGALTVVGGNLGTPEPTAPEEPEETTPDSTDPDYVPEDTEPEDVPDDTEPEENPDDTVPDETIPEETIPEDVLNEWIGQAYDGGTVYATGENAVVTIGEGVQVYAGYAVNYGGNFYIADGARLNSAGIITMGSAEFGGNVYFGTASGSFTGGEVSYGLADMLHDGLTDTTSMGGNIYLYDADVSVTDTLISGGYSYYRAGNVFVRSVSSMSLYGKTVVTGGHIPTTSTGFWGGNFYLQGALKIYDDSIVKDGVAARGGNIHTGTLEGKIWMYGGQIYGGFANAADGSDNVRIYDKEAVALYMYGGFIEDLVDMGSDNTFQVYNGLLGTTVSKADTAGGEGFVPSAEIAVVAACAHNMVGGGHTYVSHPEGLCETCGHTYASIADAEPAICALCNTSHINLGHTHTYVDGACAVCGYVLPAHTAECAHGCTDVTWIPWDGKTEVNGGHYYLTDNIYLTAGKVAPSGHMCLDLNGYTLTVRRAGQGFYINKNKSIAIMDSSAENTGVIRGYGVTTDAIGGNIRINYGKMYLYDATITGGRSLYYNTKTGKYNGQGGNIYMNGGAELIIQNGKVLNGVAEEGGESARGGNICAYSKSKVVLKGAETLIADGCATNVSNDNKNPYGGNIYCGTGSLLYMYDGTVTGGNARDGANIYLMNGSGDNVGYGYMYGGFVGEMSEDAVKSAANFMIQGSEIYISNFYMFGGEILDLHDNGDYNEIKIYAGILHQDPRTVGYGETDIIGDCSCIGYDEVTGIYTIGHTQGNTACGICSKKDEGYLKGYGESHIYTLEDFHNYSGEDHVCTDCQIIRAKITGTDELYTELPVALENGAAIADQVEMLRDIDINGYLDIYTTLELNGFDLRASNTIDAANELGKIHDAVGTGTVAADGGVYFMETNGQLPVNAKNDGVFTFEDIVMYQRNDYVYDEETGDKITDQRFVKFYIENTAKMTLLDDSIAAGAEVVARITITWTKDGVTRRHSFNYVQEWMDKYCAAWDKKMFTCYISGLDSLEDYTITGEVVSYEAVNQANLVPPKN